MLTKHERLIIIFLASAVLVGFGVLGVQEHTRKVHLEVKPSGIAHGDIDVEKLVQEAKSVNVNSADINALIRLHGIGPKLAEKIIKYRTQNGPFKDKETLKNIPGIGPKKFSEIEKYIVLE